MRNPFSGVTRFFYFFVRSVFIPWKLRSSLPRIVDQVYEVGIGSLPVILIVAAFTGLVSVVQTSYQLIGAGTTPRFILGYTVGRMVLIELGPVLTALMVSGRCASSMAAEIGTMRVTEQIDALEVMALNPYRFLVLPRIAGTFIAMPILTMVSDLVSLLVAGCYADAFLNTPFSVFSYGLIHFFYARDFLGGLAKAAFFSLVVATSGCYYGFNVQGGAKEVGRAATYAVVTAAVLVLVVDYLVALVVFG